MHDRPVPPTTSASRPRLSRARPAAAPDDAPAPTSATPRPARWPTSSSASATTASAAPTRAAPSSGCRTSSAPAPAPPGPRPSPAARLLADLLLEAVPHIPVRDLDTLVEHHHGLTGEALADALVKNATRATTVDRRGRRRGGGRRVGGDAAAHHGAGRGRRRDPRRRRGRGEARRPSCTRSTASPCPAPAPSARSSFAGSWAIAPRHRSLAAVDDPERAGHRGRATLGKRLIARFARNLGTIIPFFVGAVIGALGQQRARPRSSP